MIVALGVIILAAAAVVFYLLRSGNGGGRGRGHVSNFVHRGNNGSFPAQESGPGSWLRNLFGGGGMRNKNKKMARNGGWTQQVDNGGDEFDSESEDGHTLGIPLKMASPTRADGLPRVPTIQPLAPLDHNFPSSVNVNTPGTAGSERGNPYEMSMSTVALQAPGYTQGQHGHERSVTEYNGPLTNAFNGHSSRSPSPNPAVGGVYDTPPRPTHFVEPSESSSPAPPPNHSNPSYDSVSQYPSTISLPSTTARSQQQQQKPLPLQISNLKQNSISPPMERKSTMDSMDSRDSHMSMMSTRTSASGSKFHEHIDFT